MRGELAEAQRVRHVRLGMAHVHAHTPKRTSVWEARRGVLYDSALGELLGLAASGLRRESLDANADSVWNRRLAIESSVFDREQLLLGIDPSLELRLPEPSPTKPCGTGLV